MAVAGGLRHHALPPYGAADRACRDSRSGGERVLRIRGHRPRRVRLPGHVAHRLAGRLAVPLRVHLGNAAGDRALSLVSMAGSPAGLGRRPMVAALRLRHGVSRPWVAGGLAALLGLQLIYPQLALLAVAVLLCWSLVRRHRGPARFAAAGALLQLPYLIYLFWVWRTTPATLSAIRPVLEVGDPFGFLVLSHLTASGLIAVAIWR